jgi:hypothetical protein
MCLLKFEENVFIVSALNHVNPSIKRITVQTMGKGVRGGDLC